MAESRSPDRWVAVVRQLGPAFAHRKAAHDADDSFVADNHAELRTHRVFSAGVPAELGGGGASHAELARIYDGVHYRNSTEVGTAMGKQIGELAVKSFPRPIR